MTVQIPETYLDELAKICILANTSAYLFDRMRSSGAVQWMRRNLSANDLVSVFSANVTDDANSLKNKALAYGALVTASQHHFPIALKMLSLGGNRLKWQNEIIEFASSRSSSTTSIAINTAIQKRFSANPTPTSSKQFDIPTAQ